MPDENTDDVKKTDTNTEQKNDVIDETDDVSDDDAKNTEIIESTGVSEQIRELADRITNLANRFDAWIKASVENGATINDENTDDQDTEASKTIDKDLSNLDFRL